MDFELYRNEIVLYIIRISGSKIIVLNVFFSDGMAGEFKRLIFLSNSLKCQKSQIGFRERPEIVLVATTERF